MNPRLPILAAVFAQLSLVAFGGANVLLPEMQRQFVDAQAWLSGPEFASLVALAQAAPGPNAMIVGLLGWHVAGAAGALVATLAFNVPPALLTLAVARAWTRARAHKLGRALARGFAPITVGLVLAGGHAVIRAAGPTPLHLALAALGVLGMLLVKRGPLWILGAAALAGAVIR